MISFKNISKQFGTKQVLRDVSLDVAAGRITFVIGMSGTGKSVLMKHAVGFLHPDQGTCHVEGVLVDDSDLNRLNEVRRMCSYVFQGSALLDSMRIVDNVAMPLMRHGGLDRLEANEAALEYLDKVGARFAAQMYPAEIGGGVRKQAAIARALAMKPKYLILDEPTTSLDPVAARRIDRLTVELAQDMGVSVVVVSHDLRSIFGIADDVVFLFEGRVRAHVSREQLRTHPDEILQAFLQGKTLPPQVNHGSGN